MRKSPKIQEVQIREHQIWEVQTLLDKVTRKLHLEWKVPFSGMNLWRFGTIQDLWENFCFFYGLARRLTFKRTAERIAADGRQQYYLSKSNSTSNSNSTRFKQVIFNWHISEVQFGNAGTSLPIVMNNKGKKFSYYFICILCPYCLKPWSEF